MGLLYKRFSKEYRLKRTNTIKTFAMVNSIFKKQRIAKTTGSNQMKIRLPGLPKGKNVFDSIIP